MGHVSPAGTVNLKSQDSGMPDFVDAASAVK